MKKEKKESRAGVGQWRQQNHASYAYVKLRIRPAPFAPLSGSSLVLGFFFWRPSPACLMVRQECSLPHHHYQLGAGGGKSGA